MSLVHRTGFGVLGVAALGVTLSSAALADSDLPETMTLSAVIRDFKAIGDGGHVDFENSNLLGGTVSVGLVEYHTNQDGVPVFLNARGMKIHTEYRDSSGRPILPALYDPSRGDVAGVLTTVSRDRMVSADSFSTWYVDTPGVNLSAQKDLVLYRQGDTNVYVFDSATSPEFEGLGGFFPINNELFGNYSTTGRNYHFTTEVRTQFVHHAGDGHVFKFTGDDDVWVFIDGRLVIDLGGRHPVREQFVELDRLDWLEDGMTYSLSIFHAERKVTASNFRVETTLQLQPKPLPSVTSAFD